MRARLLLPIVYVSLTAAAWGQHVDARAGFRIDPPAGWASLPVPTDQPWVLARYQCDKFDFYIAPGRSEERKAELIILFFPEKTPEAASRPEGDRNSSEKSAIENPYVDYRDYFRNVFKDGGRMADAPKDASANNVKAKSYVCDFTPDASRAGLRKLVTWVYGVEGGDVAVQFDVLLNAFEKREPDFEKTFKSFRIIPRSGAKAAKTGASALTPGEMQKLTPEERKARKQTLADAAFQQARAKLPEGWRAEPQGRFFLLNHSDEKFALKMTGHGDAVLGWLDKNLEFIGKGEFVRKPILRICKDSQEEQSFRTGGRTGEFRLTTAPPVEIVSYKDEDDGIASRTWQDFNKALLRHWLHERDASIASNLPDWLSSGLASVFATARVKDGILIFPVGVYELEEVRELVRSGKVTPARSLIFQIAQPSPFREYEHASIVRFFVAGLGAKEARYKAAFKSYFSSLKLAIAKADREAASADSAPARDGRDANPVPETDRRNSRAARIADGAADRAFQSWRESDWKALEQDYQGSLSIK
jgi:hypothetical protein